MAGCALQEPKPIVSVIHTTYNYENRLRAVAELRARGNSSG